MFAAKKFFYVMCEISAALSGQQVTRDQDCREKMFITICVIETELKDKTGCAACELKGFVMLLKVRHSLRNASTTHVLLYMR